MRVADGLEGWLVEHEIGGAKRDWTFHFYEVPDGLRGILEYDTDLFEPATITGVADGFVRLLEAVTADPDRPAPHLDRPVPAAAP